jgi:hypothetical protein
MALNDDAMQAMIRSCSGDEPVCIQDLLKATFGEKRLKGVLKQSGGLKSDPEMYRVYKQISKIVDQAWTEKGVPTVIGPYID